jgi:hypothetical protein
MRQRVIVFNLFVILLMLACSIFSPREVPTQPPTLRPTQEISSPTIDEKPLPTEEASTSVPTLNTQGLIQPSDLKYIGAIRLPGGEDRPKTFAYGGNAMTFNPDGDPSGKNDGFPGSLFISGHDRIAYGEVPDGNQIAEINIPAPVITRSLDDLPIPDFLQDFANVLRGHFLGMEEIPRMGMQYGNDPKLGPTLFLAFGQHMQFDDQPTHALVSADLDPGSFQGEWYIGDQPSTNTNGYMFELPQSWADRFTSSYSLATGRMRDGGLAGMGPDLFAYRPFQDDGVPAATGAHLENKTLLKYDSSLTTGDLIHCMTGYQHPDEWEGGAFLDDGSGKQAVIFAGTKGTGEKFWYGYLDAVNPTKPCVDTGVTDYVTCRMADGSSCPQTDFSGCCDEASGGCATNRGWWSSRFDAQISFYDPAQLADVAAGKLESWQPQPYAVLDLDEFLFNSPPEWDRQMLGWGDQRRFRIGDVAFDRQNGILYILELYADGAKPVVHVWQINNNE